ncbi:low molecular weight phosphatase family protein [Kangiella profundi]|uniref:Low molecular weight phosphatase family protein n=1 Tax=Kangiella profundi TaxID=1561924 RepID=A0A2K9AYE4_9GAMM|nr:arsenate reductase ArsC [Kangiella profundi]AUD78879.1 low molecular weight phosphatase family protein [Kangiella profundi]GGF03344.1 protein-tyrosine-phosphatase [Kangiella profundi]
MKILFICTHNACRSVLGEVIARTLGKGRLETASAGSAPRGIVHPLTLKYLSQHGYSTDGLTSQSWDELSDFDPDVVITVCDSAAGESCPLWMGKTLKVHWGLPDPSKGPSSGESVSGDHASEEEEAKAFAHVIKVIEKRINTLLEKDFEHMDADQLKTELQQLGELF